jgi:hypothetical protein
MATPKNDVAGQIEQGHRIPVDAGNLTNSEIDGWDGRAKYPTPHQPSQLFFVWPACSHIPVFGRHRRVKGVAVTSTRLPVFDRCHILWQVRKKQDRIALFL